MTWHGRINSDGDQLCDKADCPNKWTWTFQQAFFCEDHGKGMLDMFSDPELQGDDEPGL